MSNAMAKVVGTKPPKAERKLGKIARAEKAEAEARAKYREQYAPLTAEEQAKLDACLGGKSRG